MAKFDKRGEAGPGSFSPPALGEGRGWGAQALGHGQFLPPGRDGTADGLHVPVLAMVAALWEWGALGVSPVQGGRGTLGQEGLETPARLPTSGLPRGARGCAFIFYCRCSFLLPPHHIVPQPWETWVESSS